jgi:hypothetical protein
MILTNEKINNHVVKTKCETNCCIYENCFIWQPDEFEKKLISFPALISPIYIYIYIYMKTD